MSGNHDRANAGVWLPFTPELIEAIAQRAAAIVLERLNGSDDAASPYMTIPEAAVYARCKRQRIDDLLSAQRLTRHKEGSRTLILRAELEAHLHAKTAASNSPQSRENEDWISSSNRATVDRTGNKTG
jgi:excisionase family DNA binding protein